MMGGQISSWQRARATRGDVVRRNVTTFLIAAVTAAITAGGPALASVVVDYARNADKVDGRHAVGARAEPSERAHKLVATNANGRLPNNIISKALNAELIDGTDSDALARRGRVQIAAPPEVWTTYTPGSERLKFERYINEVRLTSSTLGGGVVVAPLTVPVTVGGDAMKLTSVKFCYATGNQKLAHVEVEVIRQHEHGSQIHAGLAYSEVHFIEDDVPQGSGCHVFEIPEDRFNPPVILDDSMSVIPRMTFDFLTEPAEVYLGSVVATLEPVPGGTPPDRDTP